MLQIGIQLLDIIETLHQLGFIHSDIKPDNILFGIGQDRDLVHLIDFGKATKHE